MLCSQFWGEPLPTVPSPGSGLGRAGLGGGLRSRGGETWPLSAQLCSPGPRGNSVSTGPPCAELRPAETHPVLWAQEVCQELSALFKATYRASVHQLPPPVPRARRELER